MVWTIPGLVNDFRRNAPVRVDWIDDAVTVLTFTLHYSDVVALLDDGSLRRWRRSGLGWQEVTRTKSAAGRESFRLRQRTRVSGGGFATTQLGYNDAIAGLQSSIFFGVGQILQQLVITNGICIFMIQGCRKRNDKQAL
jgi:hypothetical protein